MTKLTLEEVTQYLSTVKTIAQRALEIGDHNLLQDTSALLRRLDSHLVPEKSKKES